MDRCVTVHPPTSVPVCVPVYLYTCVCTCIPVYLYHRSLPVSVGIGTLWAWPVYSNMSVGVVSGAWWAWSVVGW